MSRLCLTCLTSGNGCNEQGHENISYCSKWRWPRNTASKAKWMKHVSEYPYGGWTEEYKNQISKKIKEALK